VGFRGGASLRVPPQPEFRGFFEAVGPFVNDIEEMRHYEVTLASDT
jgi:hypothetical protein